MVYSPAGFDPSLCLQEAAAIDVELGRLVSGLTEAQFHAPAPMGGWSVGYCIEHLTLSGHAFLPCWDRALKEGVAGHGGYPYAWWQRWVLRSLQNPTRLRHRAETQLVPLGRQSIEKTVARFVGMHRDVAARLSAAGEVDAKRTKVSSPVVSWIRYSLGFSFDFVLAHEHRHLAQAWAVRHVVTHE